MLWTEKYAPTSREDFNIHKDIVNSFKNLVEEGDLPHLIFNGPPGSGKTILVRQLLRDLFGESADKVRMTSSITDLKVSMTRTVEVDIKALRSKCHVELSPSDYQRNDVHVIQHEMKKMNQSFLDHSFLVIVLNEVERMSKAAQNALRRTMETAATRCRLIMCCSNLSQVIDPIKSRCAIVRVPQPSIDELADVIRRISQLEGFTITSKQCSELLAATGRSLRQTILALQASYSKGLFSGLAGQPPVPEWKMMIKARQETAKEILNDQSAKSVLETRKRLYELNKCCIPPTTVLTSLFEELNDRLSEPGKRQFVEVAAKYDHELRNGGRPIYHLEAFVVNFMSIYIDHST